MRFAVTALLTATIAMAETHVVWIGGTNEVDPSVIRADIGDRVEFHFLSGLHSAVEANFNDPCFHNGGFASGLFATSSRDAQNAEAFVITIDNRDPLWFFDGAENNCMRGAVGVINPPTGSSRTLESFRKASKSKTRTSSPRDKKGGSLIKT